MALKSKEDWTTATPEIPMIIQGRLRPSKNGQKKRYVKFKVKEPDITIIFSQIFLKISHAKSINIFNFLSLQDGDDDR